MSITISSKGGIRASGKDANGLFIAMAPDEQLLKWDQEGFGSEEFKRMLKEAIAARKIGGAK